MEVTHAKHDNGFLGRYLLYLHVEHYRCSEEKTCQSGEPKTGLWEHSLWQSSVLGSSLCRFDGSTNRCIYQAFCRLRLSFSCCEGCCSQAHSNHWIQAAGSAFSSSYRDAPFDRMCSISQTVHKEEGTVRILHGSVSRHRKKQVLLGCPDWII